MSEKTPEKTLENAPNEEQRIAEQRLKDLMAQASTAAADRQAALAEANALRGELERANAELVGLRAANERLAAEVKGLSEAAATRDALTSLPVDLPKGAHQLVESVTIAVPGEDGKPVRANAKRGDVVFLTNKRGEVEELQRAVGIVARVFPIDRATAEELRALNHLR